MHPLLTKLALLLSLGPNGPSPMWERHLHAHWDWDTSLIDTRHDSANATHACEVSVSRKAYKSWSRFPGQFIWDVYSQAPQSITIHTRWHACIICMCWDRARSSCTRAAVTFACKAACICALFFWSNGREWMVMVCMRRPRSLCTTAAAPGCSALRRLSGGTKR